MNYDHYQQWAAEHGKDQGLGVPMEALRDYWESIQTEQRQTDAPELGGMSL